MRKVVVLWLLALTALPVTATAGSQSPSPEVMGIRLSMSHREARDRMKKMGNLEKEERKRQEVWALNDRRISHLIVGFDPDYRVRYLTAIVRAGGPRIRYGEVGDVKKAVHSSNQGNYKLTWTMAARYGQPAYIVVAHGRDPQYLDSYSVKRLSAEEID